MQHRTVNFSHTRITGGFWKQKQALVRRVTTKAVYDRFSDTGRIDAFRFDWKEGSPNKPHFFWDSDVAKWIEGAAYIKIICEKEYFGVLRMPSEIRLGE